MKKKLIAAAVCLLCNNLCSAQVELGLNGGITRSTLSLKNGGGSGTFRRTSRTAPYISFRAIAPLGKGWQLGLGADMATIKFNYSSFNGQSQIGNPNIPVYLFFNRKINLPKAYVYGGINAGLSFIAGRNGSKASLMEPSESMGYQAGIQAGYTQWLIKGLGINAELSVRYFTYERDFGPVFGYSDYTDLWYFPMSLGVRYKL